MQPPFIDLNISLFADDKDLLEKIMAHRDEPLPLLMRQWIRRTANRCGLLSAHPANALSQRGPTEKTRIRAETFKRLKTGHPTWNIERLAIEASKELGEVVTAETVRNAYRAMGWKWQRADRVR
jgi:transposase